MRDATSGETGQASVEHVAVVSLVALLFAGLAIAVPSGQVGEAVAARLAGAFGGAPPATAAEPDEPAPPEPRELVDRYMDVGLEDFLDYRDSPDRDGRLDWSTDLCSAPLVGSRGDSFDFTEACLRHDFGYRNYDRLGVFDEMREAVDERFYADMRDHCDGRAGFEETRCEAWAIAFYRAVRTFGGLTR